MPSLDTKQVILAGFVLVAVVLGGLFLATVCAARSCARLCRLHPS